MPKGQRQKFRFVCREYRGLEVLCAWIAKGGLSLIHIWWPMRTDKNRKYLIPNIPYLFILWAFLKLGTAYRLAAGNDLSLIHI